MGVDLICNDKSYSCGYKRWSDFRNDVIQATIAYIEKVLLPNKNGFYRDCLLEYIELFCKETENDDNKLEAFLLLQTHKNDTVCIVDVFIHYGLGGLYALCNKTDCGGFYSVGNALDICQLFDTIEDFMYFCPHWEQIREVFQESVDTKTALSVL